MALALAALVAVYVVLVFGGKSGGILKADDARVIARGEAVY
ncbi:MAG: cytochrome c, partial [Mesorhizobium sp.]